MRQEVAEEEEAKCFARWDWEEQLPSPHELVPLSQALIAPDLALAFDIPSSSSAAGAAAAASSSSSALPVDRGLVARHDASDLDASGGGGEEDPMPPRTLKRPRLVWTPQLHKRFVDAVAHLGIANAVPKTIMQIMGVEGLTRENVASHLQKYRLYLKRVQIKGLPAAASPCPAPYPFLGRAAPADPFLPYMPVAMLQQQHHHHHHHKSTDPTQQHYYHQNKLDHFAPRFLNRQVQGQAVAPPSAAMGPGMVFMPAPTTKPAQSAPLVKGEDDGADDGADGGATKRELTLFPTG